MKYLVTGGSSGLGKCVAAILSDEGHPVTTLGREGCDVNINLEDDNNFDFLVDHDIVIHCAGTNLIRPHSNLQRQDIINLLNVNAVSQFQINAALLSRVHHPIQIIHVISDAAWMPMTHSLAYNVSKAAQLMVMRQMAHEERRAIIFGVSPGKIGGTGMSDYIDTTFPALRGMTYEEGRKYQLSKLRTGELDPMEVADFIITLSDMANKHFHGHNFCIGG